MLDQKQEFKIRIAKEEDTSLILKFIKELIFLFSQLDKS